MRIVSGKYKGRKLIAPEGQHVRPTTDRVRESIFNILSHGLVEIEGAHVLDLFAGSGALGLEALSRGAAFVQFIDNDTRSRGAIRQNIEALDAGGSTKLMKRDATNLGDRFLKRGAPNDLVFLDPPYGKNLAVPALKSAINGGWLAPSAIIVLECGQDEEPDLPEFSLEDERVYGDTKVLFMSHTE